MKKVLPAFLFTLCLVFASVVLAEDATPSTTRKVKETVKERAKDNLETRKDKIETRIDNKKERIASKEAALKDRLARFKDTKKAAVVDRVNTNLNQINTRRTADMVKFLENTTRILDRLASWVAEQSSTGKDTSAANAAITEARAKIASASGAVTAQSQKDYTVTISSESAAKTDIMAQRNSLHTDLLALRKQIIDSKQSVANAIRVAKTTLGGTNGN